MKNLVTHVKMHRCQIYQIVNSKYIVQVAKLNYRGCPKSKRSKTGLVWNMGARSIQIQEAGLFFLIIFLILRMVQASEEQFRQLRTIGCPDLGYCPKSGRWRGVQNPDKSGFQTFAVYKFCGSTKNKILPKITACLKKSAFQICAHFPLAV